MEEEIYKKGLFNAYLREIRASNYGRDIREPIAKALERISEKDSQELDDLEQVISQALGSVEITPILGMDDCYTLTIRPIGGS